MACVAAVALRTGALPAWLGMSAAVTAVALAVNGSFLYAGFVPALLLFILWVLVASVVLARAALADRGHVTAGYATAAG